MEIIKELNDLSNRLETACESESWSYVEEINEELNELIYRMSDGDLLHMNFEE